MASDPRFVCIHGHFYQPPRENPWLEEVERQPTADPYHDWNARIDAECYAPNGAARVLDADHRIARLVNNYARINFNFGPTLLAWLERHATWTYEAILEADRMGAARLGHGPAIAQAYGHAILPLLDERDRRMHVRWGVRDFEHRFRRAPAGMWLPETAADVATLETLAECGIQFTILAPHQAARWRPAGAVAWTDLAGSAIDPRRAYRARLPSGRSIDLLFYDGPLSRAIAFERLLSDGERFAGRILGAFAPNDPGPQLVHVATDGETYGHHHRFGEMALAWTLERVDRTPGVELTNYTAYLAAHPPDREVEIRERTSWSCAHGLGRWTEDCGCNLGLDRGARQRWRGPLREAVDGMRERLRGPWERAASELLADPWDARDAYLEVVLDPAPERVQRFFETHAADRLEKPEQRLRALELLELQRHAQLSTTSCGWFFDDVSGIETVQVLRYAARALELARTCLGLDLEPEFLERLERAPSNFPEWRNGRRVWERSVVPATVRPDQIAAHVAISRLFGETAEADGVPAFRVDGRRLELEKAGQFRLVSGTVGVEHRRTTARAVFSAVAVHLGGHTLVAGIRRYDDEPEHAARVEAIREAFGRADVAAVIGRLEREFPGSTFKVGSLIDDRRREIIGRILANTLSDAETSLERIYEQHAPTLRFLASHDIPLPPVLRTTVEFVLGVGLRRAFAAVPPNLPAIRQTVEALENHHLRIDDPHLGLDVAAALERMARSAAAPGSSADRLTDLAEALEAALRLPLTIDLHVLHRLAASLAAPGDGGRADAALTRIDTALGFAPGLRRGVPPEA